MIHFYIKQNLKYEKSLVYETNKIISDLKVLAYALKIQKKVGRYNKTYNFGIDF